MRAARHIGLLLAVMVMAFSCGRQGRVIPAHKFAKIYAKMLVADQWVRGDSHLAAIADTTLFYEPILEEFGYTEKDYVVSVGHYMEDPESFGKIFKEVKEILDKRISELTADERAVHRADSIRAAIAGKNFLRAPVFMDTYMDSVRHDTVSISIDTIGMYVWARILPDTLYSGPVFALRHELDSIPHTADTVKTVVDTVQAMTLPEPKVNAKRPFPALGIQKPHTPLRIAK